MKTSKLFLFSICAALACLSSAVASTFTVSTTTADGPVSGTATLTFVDSTHLQLVLTNTETAAQVVSPGQSLSNLEFNLTGGGTIAAGGIAGTGALVNISGTTATPAGSGIPSGEWGVTLNVGGFQYQVSALFSPAQPNYMIIGGNLGTTSYPNANGGVPNFNPYVQGPATFTLTGTGFTAATDFSSVTFSWGTSPDFFTPGTRVPDNGLTVALFGLGLAGLELVRRVLVKRQAIRA